MRYVIRISEHLLARFYLSTCLHTHLIPSVHVSLPLIQSTHFKKGT